MLLEAPADGAIAGAIDAQSFVHAGTRARWLGELSQLRAVDASIARARLAMVSLGEADALRELADAERTLQAALVLPGAAAFYAELQLQLGVSAAQLGQLGLAQAAFARAARVDPSRRLLAGEAAPEVVVLATRAFELAERAPEGEVRIAVDAPDARVFLDDRERGRAPLSVREKSGPHVLRIEAPGRVPYASLFEIAEGQRPEQRFSLAAEPRLVALDGVRATLTQAPAAELERAVQRVFTSAPELRALVLGERRSTGPRDARGFVIWCARRACREPRTWQGARAFGGALLAPATSQVLSSRNLSEARAWLRTATVSVTDAAVAHATLASVWQRWYVWTAVSAAVLGGVALAAVAARSDPEHQVRVSVDPSALH